MASAVAPGVQLTIPEDSSLLLPRQDATNRDVAVFDDIEADEHVLQITFDPQVQANRRRKSSIVNMEHLSGSAIPKDINSSSSSSSGSRSSCFVHALLDLQKELHHDALTEDTKVNKHPLKNSREGRVGLDTEHSIPPFMTKSELSDMVLGVGELSKHFASMQIKMKIKTVMLLTKTCDKGLIVHTRKLAEWLLSPERGQGYIVYVESTFKESLEFDTEGLLSLHPTYRTRLHWWNSELCAKRPNTFDFVMTLGGDGTVLYASWLFQKVVPPVFSFALGSLGFLTKFDFSAFEETLTGVIKDGVMIGLRLRFEGVIMRSNPKIDSKSEGRDLTKEILDVATNRQLTHRFHESYTVLNEIVVDRGPNATMSSTELYADDVHLTSIEADGVCIATPTGSTAYNLAAGGSLCHPEIPAMLVSPICAHSLTFRPLILPDSMVLRVGVPYDARTTAWVSFDGRQRIELHQGDYVTITASRFPFPSVQCKRENKDWFGSIRRTMNWGVRQRQQSFSHHD